MELLFKIGYTSLIATNTFPDLVPVVNLGRNHRSAVGCIEKEEENISKKELIRLSLEMHLAVV